MFPGPWQSCRLEHALLEASEHGSRVVASFSQLIEMFDPHFPCGFQFWMTPERYPLSRMGTPEEVAKAIIHLSTATFTTGENYRVDGGLLAGCYWSRDM